VNVREEHSAADQGHDRDDFGGRCQARAAGAFSAEAARVQALPMVAKTIARVLLKLHLAVAQLPRIQQPVKIEIGEERGRCRPPAAATGRPISICRFFGKEAWAKSDPESASVSQPATVDA